MMVRCAPPCGYCLKASMTPCHVPALWFPAYAGMTVRDAGNDGRARPSRHCGLDPQSRGVACGAGEQVQTNQILPSPLMGEESKVRVSKTTPPHNATALSPLRERAVV